MGLNLFMLLAFTSAIAVFTCTTNAAGLPITTGCSYYPADVVFLLDASNDVWLPDFRHQLDFVKDIASRFTISKQAVRVGIVTFADYPQVQIELSENENVADLQSAIDSIQQSGGYHLHTGDALRYIREVVFGNNDQTVSVAERSASNASRVVIVITRGPPDDPDETVQQASINRDAHIHVFAVGVGDLIDVKDLDAISSQPTQHNTLQVESYAMLSGISDTLTASICKALHGTSHWTSASDSDRRRQVISAEPSEPTVHYERTNERGDDETELKDRTPFMILLGGDVTMSTTATGSGRGNQADNDGNVDSKTVVQDDGVDGDEVGSKSTRNQSVIEISNGPPGGEGWNWRYDEHGSKIWYRIPVRGIRVDKSQMDADLNPTSRFPPTYYSPPNSTVPPPRGYWLVDEQGHHVWYRYDGPGHYIRDPSVMINRSLSIRELDGRLTWSGVGDLYWIVDAYGHKVWYKMTRHTDGSPGELFSRVEDVPNDETINVSSSASSSSSSLKGETDHSAPHVYLSSGPGGRGGYWAIDEHSHYVWYHYVAPNVFEKDESTATDVMSVPPDYQPQQPPLQPPITSKRTSTGELRRRPSKELGWGRAVRPAWLTRAPSGRRLTTMKMSLAVRPTSRSSSSTPSISSVSSVANSDIVAAPNRGYWVLDKTGKMTWHSYQSYPDVPRSKEQETAVDSEIYDNRIPSDNNQITPSPRQPVKTTAATTTVVTSTTPITQKPTTLFRRKAEVAREKPSGHWTRGKSGKMEWHTFGPTRTTSTSTTTTTTTTTTVTTPTTPTTVGLTTPSTSTTTISPTTASLTTMTSLPHSTATQTSTTMMSTSGGVLEGNWVIDKFGRSIWHQVAHDVTSATATQRSTQSDVGGHVTFGGSEGLVTRAERSRDNIRTTNEMTLSTEGFTTVTSTPHALMTSQSLTSSISDINIDNERNDTSNRDYSDGRHGKTEDGGALPSNRSVVDALGESLKQFLLNVERSRDNVNSSHVTWGTNDEDDNEMFRKVLLSMNDTSIRSAVRDIINEPEVTLLPVTVTSFLTQSMRTVEHKKQSDLSVSSVTSVAPNLNKPTVHPRVKGTTVSRGSRLPQPTHVPAGGEGQRTKKSGARVPSKQKRPPTTHESQAWKQFIKEEESDREESSDIDQDISDVIRRQHPVTGGRPAVPNRRRTSRPKYRRVTAGNRVQVQGQGQVGVSSPSPATKSNMIWENTVSPRKVINSIPKAPCRPRTPLDIVFAVDQRSQSPLHASHLWQIAFSVMSTIRIDESRIRVRFIPEMMNQPSGSVHGTERRRTHEQSTVSPGYRTVADIIDELASNLRQETRMTPVARRKDEKYRRRIGVYLTDGRSPDTAGTVLAIERATANLGRRVNLVAVGVGPEVSMTQLFSVTRGRRDRLLTVYTGSHGDQLTAGLRDVSNRLVEMLCDGHQR